MGDAPRLALGTDVPGVDRRRYRFGQAWDVSSRRMSATATPIQVGFDCADPNRLASSGPRRSATRRRTCPRAPRAGRGSWPPRASPRIFFQRVPEAKTVKNRLHLDLNVGGRDGAPSEERRRRVDAEVQRLLEARATGLAAIEEEDGGSSTCGTLRATSSTSCSCLGCRAVVAGGRTQPGPERDDNRRCVRRTKGWRRAREGPQASGWVWLVRQSRSSRSRSGVSVRPGVPVPRTSRRRSGWTPSPPSSVSREPPLVTRSCSPASC